MYMCGRFEYIELLSLGATLALFWLQSCLQDSVRDIQHLHLLPTYQDLTLLTVHALVWSLNVGTNLSTSRSWSRLRLARLSTQNPSTEDLVAIYLKDQHLLLLYWERVIPAVTNRNSTRRAIGASFCRTRMLKIDLGILLSIMRWQREFIRYKKLDGFSCPFLELDPNHRNTLGETFLYVCRASSSDDLVTYLEIQKALMKQGFDSFCRDHSGWIIARRFH